MRYLRKESAEVGKRDGDRYNTHILEVSGTTRHYRRAASIDGKGRVSGGSVILVGSTVQDGQGMMGLCYDQSCFKPQHTGH